MGWRPDPLPPLHVVTDDAVVARPDFPAHARRVFQAGGRGIAFHLRAPRADGRRVYELARDLVPLGVLDEVLFVVNDRVDVAMVLADGVHVGRRGLRPRDARRLVGRDRLLGVSVHDGAAARDAVAAGADYLFAGHVWDTPSHPGEPARGLDLVRAAASGGTPVFAIGGVTVERVPEARQAGAVGVAVIRGIWDAPDPAAAVERYLEAWKG